MKLLVALGLTAALCTVHAARADCTYPTPPDKIPDGRTATMADMVAGQKAVKEYDKAINAYLACIQLERDDSVAKLPHPLKPGEKPTPEQQKALDDLDRVVTQKHNAAIDQDQSVAERFNEQVRAFKARSDQKK
jgi:hypothetical protein